MPALGSSSSLARRAKSFEPVSGIDIAGLCFAGAIVLGALILLLIRYQPKWAKTRGAAVMSRRGVEKDGPQTEKSEANFDLQNQSTKSREQSVKLPEKVLHRPPRMQTNEDVINYHRQSGTFPKPFSFALSAGSSSESIKGGGDRQSFMSHKSRFSVISSNTSSSVDLNPTLGNVRKVRQVFDPVLPDELLLTRPGEKLTLVQSFDDGWCLVGREGGGAHNSTNAKLCLFKQNVTVPPGDSNVELGVVPAWCFVKPPPGLRAERPIRSTSLGLTVQMTASAPGLARDRIISWSNF